MSTEPWIVRFDFIAKNERTATLQEAHADHGPHLYYWVDIDASTVDATAAMRELGINETVVQEAIGIDVDGRYDVYDECLHVAATAAGFKEERIKGSHVDIILTEHAIVTVRRGTVDFIEQVKKRYHQDFVKFAKSPSFLVYELFDTLIQSYRKSIGQLEVAIERVRSRIFGDVDDTIFNQVSDITADVLELRKIMLAVRDVLHELATRRSPFVSETSQPFLDRMTDTVARLTIDLGVDREVLGETLNLYMGMVSHRTNAVVRRLTVFSVIFLPLTFLSSIYGMNFDRDIMMPELTWAYGYKAFWATAATLTLGLLWFMKRKKWL